MGRAAFYHGESNPPEGIQISATFMELEYWIQDHMSATPTRANSPDDANATNM